MATLLAADTSSFLFFFKWTIVQLHKLSGHAFWIIPLGAPGVTRDMFLPLGYTRPDQPIGRELCLNSLYIQSNSLLHIQLFYN